MKNMDEIRTKIERLQAMSVEDRLKAVWLERCIHCGRVDDSDEFNVCSVCGAAYCDSCPAQCQCDVDKAVEAITDL